MAVLNMALDSAGTVLMKHYGKLAQSDIATKSNAKDLVTVADKESEAAIRAIISKHFPDHRILGEEEGGDYKSSTRGTRWIIDPLDGTTNFSHSFPQFSISVGVEHNGKMEVAGIFAPYYQERFLAMRGRGATMNDVRIRTSERLTLAECLAVTGFPYDRSRVGHFLNDWAYVLPQVHGVLRLGSAAIDMAAVACGRLDLFWEEGLHAWDTAAGWLLIEEAGGKVTDFSGGEFSPFTLETLATNGKVHAEACALMTAARTKESYFHEIPVQTDLR